MTNKDAWKKFINKLNNDEDFRKKFEAIEVPDGPTPDVKVPQNKKEA